MYKENDIPQLPSLRVCEEGMEVTFEFISTRRDDISSASKDRADIKRSLDEIDHMLAENEQAINDLDVRIDRLTSHADKTDCLLAVASGVIAGLIDSFFTGDVKEAHKWGSEKIGNYVINLAKKQGYKGRGEKTTLKGAISFLERNFPIAADKATDIFGGAKQHHLGDFSHHPTPVGLFFSMLTQFTGNVYGANYDTISEGHPPMGAFIVKKLEDTDLIGVDIHQKIALGFWNWIYHMASDMAGSSGSANTGTEGTGLPGPLLSLLKELSSCKLFNNAEEGNKFSLWISKLFNGTLLKERDENGKIILDTVVQFDLRTELGILHQFSIPVLINEVLVRCAYFVRRLCWQLKEKDIQTFDDVIHKIDWKQTLPFMNRTIARMVTIASGTFVAVDAIDAAIRAAIKSGLEPNMFFAQLLLRINVVGVGRFVLAGATDVGMGMWMHHLERKRMRLVAVQGMLKNATVYYKIADTWILAKDVQEAMEKMQETMDCAIIIYVQSLEQIGGDTLKISQSLRPIKEKNPSLLDDISKMLES